MILSTLTLAPSTFGCCAKTPAGPVTPKPGEPGLKAPLLDGLGDHHHPITTNQPLAQRLFNQGLVLHFAFNHGEAIRSFNECARLDPGAAACMMGAALALGPNLNAEMDPDAVGPAWELSRQALALAEAGKVSEREAAYIRAVAARYGPPGPANRALLDQAYVDALAKLVEEYPNELDAAALYAEALMVMHPWDYWTADYQPRAWTPRILEVLESLLARNPNHIFANHLYIHAVEASSEPERGLGSARRLGDLAPGAGHLVHMPAHIYIRVGDYHAASLANERAILADERYFAQVQAQGVYPLAYRPHNYHFLWATTLLEGRRERSLAAAEQLAAHVDRQMMRVPGFGTLQHFLVIPLYGLVAFGEWDRILVAEPPPEDLLYPRGVWRFARGMAYASKGELAKAKLELEHVHQAAMNEALDDVTIWGMNSTRVLMQIAEQVLAARIAQGHDDAARVTHLRAAVELEDTLAYDEPPPWKPSTRRYLGQALLDIGDAVGAEQVYREDLAEFPHNGWSLYGLLAALRAQGKSDAARVVEARLLVAWARADVVLTSSAF